MAMQPSEAAYHNLCALAAKIGASSSVVKNFAAAYLDDIAAAPAQEQPAAIKKALTGSLVRSLRESHEFLESAAASRQSLKNAAADSSMDARSVEWDDRFGAVQNRTMNTFKTLELLQKSDPQMANVFISIPNEAADNLAALHKISPATAKCACEGLFGGQASPEKIREWVGLQSIGETAPAIKSSKSFSM